MHSRIIVPVNDTDRSERALSFAAHFARGMGASLALVTVIGDGDRRQTAVETYHEWLMRPYRDIEAESIVLSGDIAPAILSACQPGDILFVGADKKSLVHEMLFASVVFDLVRTFSGPVVAIGPNATVPEEARNLLICRDGDERVDQALGLLKHIAVAAALQPKFISSESSGQTGHSVRKAIRLRSEQDDVAAICLAIHTIEPVQHIFSPSFANELIGEAKRPLVIINASSPICVARRPIRRCVPTSEVRQSLVGAS